MSHGTFRRVEDQRLVSGLGRYSADLPADHCLHGAFVRSPHAHARIVAIDADAAKSLPGIVAIIDAAQIASMGIGGIPETNNVPPSPESLFAPARWPALARDRVRYVGEAVALVVATSAAAAQDGAEAVDVSYESLDPVVGVTFALGEGATLVHGDARGNIAARFSAGDRNAVTSALAGAAHVVSARLVIPRLAAAPMEPRSALASYDSATGRYTLTAPSQGVGLVHRQLATALNVPADQVRVVTQDVGGGFGARAWLYPEYLALLAASHVTRRDVRWISTRNEAMQADTHGRGLEIEARLALDAKGMFLALDVENLVDLGAYNTANSAFISCNNFVRSLVGPYRTPNVAARVTCAFTNSAPVAAYRGAGRPEGNYVMERLIDQAASECGFDRLRLRKQNMIPERAMPYRTPVGFSYDSGNFLALIDTALEAVDQRGFRARRKQAMRKNRLRGLGVGCFVEPAGGPPHEMARLSFSGDGTILVDVGGQSIGTSHATVFREVAARMLELPPERFVVRQGDSDRHRAGAGSIASRSAVANGQALAAVTEKLLDKARKLAALLLQDAPDRLIYKAGNFSAQHPANTLDLFSLHEHSRSSAGLPADLAGGLDVEAHIEARPTFPNGCHVAEIEIDMETGVAALARYIAVDDCGVVLNETVVEGQIVGGVVQGFGEATREEIVYDESGQLATGSFMDYAMPRAIDVPMIETLARPTRCTTNPLGAKGAGESGTTGSLSAIVNAINDALASANAQPIDMPCTPQKIWQALRDARPA